MCPNLHQLLALFTLHFEEMDSHLEHRAFNNMIPVLVHVIQYSVGAISDECLARRLVGEDTYSSILEKEDTSANKARLLLTNISTDISLKASRFGDFADILEDIESCSELAQALRDELRDLQDRAKRGQPQDSTSEHRDQGPTAATGKACESQSVSTADGNRSDELINTAYSSGPEVIELCLEKLKSPTFNMPDDNEFMRRVAYVMSDFGRDMKGNGGIWQLSTTAFKDTKDTSAHYSLPRKYYQIWKAFGIDWSSVQYSDLNKPFYSALAARLYLSNFAEYIPPPHQIGEQAEYWKFKYMRGEGDMLKFKEKVLKLIE